MVTLRLRSDARELARLQRELATLATAHGLSGPDENTLQMVLEEIVTNIISHGRRATEISVELAVTADALAVEVADDGIPFDPLQADPAAVDAPLEQREAGGLGIHLVRSFAEEVCYRRHGDSNQLSLTIRRTARPD